LAGSKWGNPFKLVNDTPEDRLEVIGKYKRWLLSQKDLMSSLHEIRGLRLGCWCKTSPDVLCHGDVLLDLANR
jgi:hypothetical protein